MSTSVRAWNVETDTVADAHLNEVKKEGECEEDHVVEDWTALVEIGHGNAECCQNGLRKEREEEGKKREERGGKRGKKSYMSATERSRERVAK